MINFISFIQDKKRILKRRKKPGNDLDSEEKDDPLWERKSAKLSQQATEIKENVTRLRELLQESRAGYLGLANADMSDRQRNEIDNGQRKSCLSSEHTSQGSLGLPGATRFIQTCHQLIDQFQKDFKSIRGGYTETHERHVAAVKEILEKYLKEVCQMYAQQKAIRVERALEIEKVSRLEAMARSSENFQTFESSGFFTITVFS